MQDSSDRSGQLRQGARAKTVGKKGETAEVLITLPAIVDSIYKQHGLPKEVVRAIIDDCFVMIEHALVADCRVRIENFGSLKLAHGRSHLGPYSKISFKMGRRFKLAANEARNELK